MGGGLAHRDKGGSQGGWGWRRAGRGSWADAGEAMPAAAAGQPRAQERRTSREAGANDRTHRSRPCVVSPRGGAGVLQLLSSGRGPPRRTFSSQWHTPLRAEGT